MAPSRGSGPHRPWAGESVRPTPDNHDLLHLAPVAVFACDCNGRVTYCNEAARELGGYRPADGDCPEVFGDSWKLFLPDGTPLTRGDTPMAAASRTGAGVRNAELILERPDGSRVWMLGNVEPLRDESGAVIGAICALTDVTERRKVNQGAARAQEELDRLEADIRRLHELGTRLSPDDDFGTLLQEILQAVCSLMQAPMGCLRMVDEARKVLRLNAAVGYGPVFEKLLSTTVKGQAACGIAWQRRERVIVEDVRTDPIFDGERLQSVADRAGFRAVCSVPLLSRSGNVLGTISVNYRQPYRPSGRQLWLLDLYARQAAEVIDVIQRRRAWQRAERVAAEGEQRLRVAAEAAGFGTYDNDLVSGTRHWSPEMCTILGIASDGISPAAVGSVPEFIHPDDRECVRKMMRRAHDPNGDGLVEHEHRIVRPDRKVRWVLVKGRVQFAGEGNDRRPVRSSGVLIDITDRKRAEQALRESEQRFRATFEQAAVGIAQVAVDGTWLRVNERYCRILGYERDELLQLTFREITHPDDLERDLAHARRLLAGEADSYSIEKRYIRKDGGIVWVNLFGSVVRDEAGNPLYFIAAAEDITERKRAEAELTRTRERLEVALSAGHVATWVWDVKTDRVHADRNLAYFYNVPASEADRAPLAVYIDSVHGDDRRRVAETIQSALDGGQNEYEAEYRVTGADGVTRWVLARGLIERDANGRAIRMPGVILDVTERKQVEAALARSLAQFQALFDRMTEGLVLFDPQGNLLDMNPAALAMHGFDDAALLRRHLDALTDTFELADSQGQPLPTSQWPIGRVLRGETFSRYEVRVRRTDTDRTWYASFGGAPVYDSDGQLMLGIVTLRDVTAEHEADEALREARAAAEAASVAKSQFLANMSHELRTPMNAILGMTDLALREQLPSPVRDYLRTVKDSGQSLLDLLNTLLDFSRIEAGRMELDACSFSLRETVKQVVKTLGLRAAEKDLELICDIEPDVPEQVVGDPLRLRQVLMNLTGNAIKFTDGGEVVITVAVESLGEKEVRLGFQVRDTGKGIALEDQERIFSPFAQADASTTRRHGGSGLGLAIVRNLVEMMDGEVRLQSELGRGSTFSFTVRLELSKESPAPCLLQAPARQAFSDLPVLIVANNATGRRMLERMTASWGMQPTVARNVPEALTEIHQAVASGRRFGLLLTDADLPDIDGFTLAEWVAKDPSLAGPVVLMHSATESSNEAGRCRELGASCIEKPIAQSDLFDTIVRALGLEQAPSREEPAPVRSAPSRALRILLAEDTPANQKLAKYLLTRRGHAVEVVEDGQQAVDLLRREDFDVVLMDIQMPVMDGLRATAAIRELDDPIKASIPIIAMTAHALRGDDELCLSAGMDHYISKPIDADQLIDLVERMGDERSGDADSPARTVPARQGEQPAPEPRPSTEAPVFDLDEGVQRCFGEYEMFTKMVSCLFAEADELLAAMRAALENGDAEALHRAAHRLKNTVVYLGANPAREAIEHLDNLARAGELSAAPPALARLAEEVERLKSALADHRAAEA